MCNNPAYRRKYYLGLFYLGIIMALLSFGVPESQGQEYDNKNADSVVNLDTLNDGPHVFLRDDTTAVIFYVCGEEVIKEVRHGRDTVRFHGLCGDSARVYAVAMSYLKNNTYIYENVNRIFTVSDIHGEYDYFKDILINAGVVDESLHWSWGNGHLVVLGDIFDRGSRVTECLWLVYHLQQEALRTGGRVHFVLGNHELMVLRGDNRYVHERYLDGIVRKTRIKHEDLYGSDMALGRWLRVQPTVIKINDLLFVHGGLNPELVNKKAGLDFINETAANGLDISSGRLAFDDEVKYLFGSYGPFWYRGYHYAVEERYEQATVDEIDNILNFYGVKKVIVGHSEREQIMGLYENRVIAVDVPVEELGGFQGLLLNDSVFYLVQPDGVREPLK